MESTYLVTYDLNNPGQNYQKVLDTIKKYNWARLSESSYAIKTAESAGTIHGHFTPFLDANDRLYVIQLVRNYSGRGPTEVNDWLRNFLF